eukprot:TRINITY_DN2633_c0_g2_i3.p1 TRINITY_DN2633_c0_g2~~TRINITY_DN2633_c0_g2_i3.p1  ORF type:complete len:401 (+),score=123.62 TRINITY_DN2633_c0_g2_i3:55-1257(+)
MSTNQSKKKTKKEKKDKRKKSEDKNDKNTSTAFKRLFSFWKKTIGEEDAQREEDSSSGSGSGEDFDSEEVVSEEVVESVSEGVVENVSEAVEEVGVERGEVIENVCLDVDEVGSGEGVKEKSEDDVVKENAEFTFEPQRTGRRSKLDRYKKDSVDSKFKKEFKMAARPVVEREIESSKEETDTLSASEESDVSDKAESSGKRKKFTLVIPPKNGAKFGTKSASARKRPGLALEIPKKEFDQNGRLVTATPKSTRNLKEESLITARVRSSRYKTVPSEKMEFDDDIEDLEFDLEDVICDDEERVAFAKKFEKQKPEILKFLCREDTLEMLFLFVTGDYKLKKDHGDRNIDEIYVSLSYLCEWVVVYPVVPHVRFTLANSDSLLTSLMSPIYNDKEYPFILV